MSGDQTAVDLLPDAGMERSAMVRIVDHTGADSSEASHV